MRKLTVVRDGDPAAGLQTAALFTRLWDALADLLGTAATATILRRAARRALPHAQELGQLTFDRVDDQFTYAVPASFHRTRGPSVALRALAGELQPLLEESIGPLAQRHLARVPELQHWAARAS